MGTVEHTRPEIANLLAAAAAVAQHPEADVGASVGQRERPGITGQQVGVEPHDQIIGSWPTDAADVLADGMPLAEVAVATDAQGLPCRTPHPVGGHDMAGSDVAQPFDAEHGIPVGGDGCGLDPVSEAHVDAGGYGELDERGVELQSGSNRRVDSLAGWQRHLERTTRRGPQHGAVDGAEFGHRRRIESEALELAQGQRRQPVAAALVARELGLVDEQDVAAGAAQGDRCGDSCRPSPDDERVDHWSWSAATAIGSAYAGPIALRLGNCASPFVVCGDAAQSSSRGDPG